MSKNPNVKSNGDGDEEDDDDDDDDDGDDDVDDDDVDDDDDDGDDDETLRRGCYVKRLTRHMARVPFEGGGGGVPFSWSFKDKGSSPPLCFAK